MQTPHSHRADSRAALSRARGLPGPSAPGPAAASVLPWLLLLPRGASSPWRLQQAVSSLQTERSNKQAGSAQGLHATLPQLTKSSSKTTIKILSSVYQKISAQTQQKALLCQIKYFT